MALLTVRTTSTSPHQAPMSLLVAAQTYRAAVRLSAPKLSGMRSRKAAQPAEVSATFSRYQSGRPNRKCLNQQIRWADAAFQTLLATQIRPVAISSVLTEKPS